MDQEQSRFEGWAVIEIMGHQKEIGYVTTAYFGGPALFRVDQPPLAEREIELVRPQWIDSKHCPAGTKIRKEAMPGKTVFVGPPAVFRLSPCSEETARRAIEELLPREIKILHMPERSQLVAAGHEDSDPDDEDIDDEAEFLRRADDRGATY